MHELPTHPRLRPLESTPYQDRWLLRDPRQIAEGALVVDTRQLSLLALLDGSRAHLEIQTGFARMTGELLLSSDLQELLGTLNRAGYLEGPGFELYYRGLLDEYRRGERRPLRHPDGFGVPRSDLAAYLDGILETVAEPRRPLGRIRGIVAPHLDYARGLPCYAAAYSAVRANAPPERVIVLGTNHFGLSQSVVATDRDFETAWGYLPTDRRFLQALADRCEGNLFPYELDHLREHSVELHAIWVHHLWGADTRLVPVLCPDPSGPLGTSPGSMGGVDLAQFAHALRELLCEDEVPTLLVASADLSHFGRYFGDDRDLDEAFLTEIHGSDLRVLELLDAHSPEQLRLHMLHTGNRTRVCSTGCLYATALALGPECRPHRLAYHQATTPELQNAVSCCAYVYAV